MENGVLEVTIVVSGDAEPELTEGYKELYRISHYENVSYYERYAPEKDDYEGDARRLVSEMEELLSYVDPEDLKINICMGEFEGEGEDQTFVCESANLGVDEIGSIRERLAQFCDSLAEKYTGPAR